jgi:hypothetical protein
MGINWSNRDYDSHLSYTRFAVFRELVARLVGIDLPAMEDWGGERKCATVADPIAFLFQESESQGGFDSGQCRVLADRITELMAAHPEARETLEWFAGEFEIGAQTGCGVAWE